MGCGHNTVTVSQQRSRGAWHANYSAAVLSAWKALREASPPVRPGGGRGRSTATPRGRRDGRPVLCKAHGFSGAAASMALRCAPASGLARLAGLAGVSEAGSACTLCESWSRGDPRVIRSNPSVTGPAVSGLRSRRGCRTALHGRHLVSFHVSKFIQTPLLKPLLAAAINNPCLLLPHADCRPCSLPSRPAATGERLGASASL